MRPVLSPWIGRLVVLFALGLSVLSATAAETTKPPWGDGPPPPGGDFVLQSAKGPVALHDLRGKVVLMYFGYASCPDVCPMDLRIVAEALEGLPESLRPQVQGIFVSLDPARDTPQKLAEYTAFFHPQILGLTADEKTLREVASRYGVQYYTVTLKDSALGYAVNHSAALYVIDPEGTLRFIFPHKTPAKTLIEAVRYLLSPGQGADQGK